MFMWFLIIIPYVPETEAAIRKRISLRCQWIPKMHLCSVEEGYWPSCFISILVFYSLLLLSLFGIENEAVTILLLFFADSLPVEAWLYKSCITEPAP